MLFCSANLDQTKGLYTQFGVTDALATRRILDVQTHFLDALTGRILDVGLDAPDADAPNAFQNRPSITDDENGTRAY